MLTTKKLTIMCLLMVLLISPVLGETAIGNLTDYYSNTNNFIIPVGSTAQPIIQVYIGSTENFRGLSQLTRYDVGSISSYDIGAPSSATSQITVNDNSGALLFSGTFGYVRNYNLAGYEDVGYQYITNITNFNNSHIMTGNKILSINFPHGYPPYNVTTPTQTPGYPSSGMIVFGNHYYDVSTGMSSGSYTNTKKINTVSSYSISNSSGVGMEGTIKKYINGIAYPSRIIIYKTSDNSIVASEGAINSNNFYFNVLQQGSIYVSMLTSVPRTINSSQLFIGTVDPYRIFFYPTNFSFTSSTIGTIDPGVFSLTEIKYFAFTDVTSTTTHPLIYSPDQTYIYNFLKTGSTWYGYTISGGYSKNLGANMPNNLVFSNFSEGGTHTIKTTIIDTSEREYSYYNDIIIEDQLGLPLTIYPLDYLTGNFISGSTIYLQNYQSKKWINRTVLSINDCNFLVSEGFFNIRASALNYDPQNNGLVYIDKAQAQQIILYPLSTPTGNLTNSTTYIKVYSEPNFDPVNKASITINGITYITGNSGTTTFNLINNTVYKADITALGYISTSQSFTTNSNPYYINFVLNKIGSGVQTFTVTSLPTIIPTRTIIPVTFVTPKGSDSLVTCGNISTNATFIDQFRNALACNGVKTQGSVNYIIALFIIMLCGYVLSRFAKGIGALAGIIAGFVISVGLELIPVWILIAVIIIAGIVIASMLMKNNGG